MKKTVLYILVSQLLGVLYSGAQEPDYKIEIKGEKKIGYTIRQIEWGFSKDSNVTLYILNEDIVASVKAVAVLDKGVAEWRLVYLAGEIIAAERKMWKHVGVSFKGAKEKNIGEALFKIETWLSHQGVIKVDDLEVKKELDSLLKVVSKK